MRVCIMFTATRIFIHMQYHSGTIFIMDIPNKGHLCIQYNVYGPSIVIAYLEVPYIQWNPSNPDTNRTE